MSLGLLQGILPRSIGYEMWQSTMSINKKAAAAPKPLGTKWVLPAMPHVGKAGVSAPKPGILA